MFFYQTMVEGLGCYSYMIGSQQTGECVVVDPQRDVERYLEIAHANRLTITRVIETHARRPCLGLPGAGRLHRRGDLPARARRRALPAYGALRRRHTDARRVLHHGAVHAWPHARQHLPACSGLHARRRGRLCADRRHPDGGRCRAARPGAGAGGRRYGRAAVPQPARAAAVPADDTRLYPGHGAGSLCARNIRDGNFTTIEAGAPHQTRRCRHPRWRPLSRRWRPTCRNSRPTSALSSR